MYNFVLIWNITLLAYALIWNITLLVYDSETKLITTKGTSKHEIEELNIASLVMNWRWADGFIWDVMRDLEVTYSFL